MKKVSKPQDYQPEDVTLQPVLHAKANLFFKGLNNIDLAQLKPATLGMLLQNKEQMDFDITVAEDVQMIRVEDGDNPGYSIISRDKGGGDFWDHSLKAFVEFNGEELSKVNIDPADSFEMEVQEYDQEIHVQGHFEDATLGRCRVEMVFSRNTEWAPFSASLFKAMHFDKTAYRKSGFPYEKLSGMGLVISEKMFVGKSLEPATEFVLKVTEVSVQSSEIFDAPADYRPLAEVIKPDFKPAPPQERKGKPGATAVKIKEDNTIKKAGFPIDDMLTPECNASTRFGSISASIHQDFFDHMATAVNTVAPFVGPVNIAGDTLSIPWLSSLSSTVGTSTTAPGSGLLSLLRERRSTTVPGIGGHGVLDKLAWKDLSTKDGNGKTRLETEFDAGTINTTLMSWGVQNAEIMAITDPAVAGDITRLSYGPQAKIVEAFELANLATFTVSGLSQAFGPFDLKIKLNTLFGPVDTPSLMQVSLANVGGTVNFGSLMGSLLITSATIGSTGNVVITLMLPDIDLMATVIRNLTWLGVAIIGSSFALSFLFPLLAPFLVSLNFLLIFITNNVTAVTASSKMASVTLDVTWQFDNNTKSLAPVVTVVGTSGTVVITTQWVTPNFIANFFETMISGIGDLFNLWLPVLASQAAAAIQLALRSNGLELPVSGRQTNLIALDGTAMSTPGSIINLNANILPVSNVSAQPYVTQVATSMALDQELQTLHLKMRNDLNPQVVPITMPPVIKVGSYFGLGLSQNAINYYLFSQWLSGRFEFMTNDPGVIALITGLLPVAATHGNIQGITIWSATPPRIETMPMEIVNSSQPLLIFFDDVRACLNLGADGPMGVKSQEVAFNVKTTGTILFEWPMVFNVVVDPNPVVCDERSWEFTDTVVLDIMKKINPAELEKLVHVLSDLFFSGLPVNITTAPASPGFWNRELIATQQEFLPAIPSNAFLKTPQQFYLEILHRRKAMYLLPAIDSVLLEFVDGSGAPTLNNLLSSVGIPPVGVSLSTMTTNQGAFLRDLVPLPVGP